MNKSDESYNDALGLLANYVDQNYIWPYIKINMYGASHLVTELFIGCVDHISSPKMKMYDQKNKS